MELLRFTVRNQRLSGGRIRLVSDSIDYVEAFFDFRTDEWEGLSKWAHFEKGEAVYDLNLVEDKITADMHLNLEAGTWEVKLHGTDSEGTKRITTDTAFVIVEAYGEGFNPLPEIPLTAAEQIDAKSQLALDTANAASGNASEAIAKATEIYEAAARGDFNGKDGEKGDPGITPEIQIGNVETLEPGEEAIVTIGGTVEKPIMNFGIPQGEKGVGIEEVSVEQSLENGGFNSVEFILTDGEKYGIAIMNGNKGKDGKDGVGIEEIKITQNNLPGGATQVEFHLTDGAMKGFVLYNGKDGKDADENRIDAIEEELAVLNPFKVTSFAVSPSVVELGDSVSAAVISWVLNKEPVSLTVAGQAVVPAKSGSLTVNEEISGTKTFSLSATDAKGSAVSKDVSINFYNGIYYGVSAVLQEIDTSVLTKTLSNTRKRSFSVNAGEGEYIWYAVPTRLGTCTFKVGGFEGGFDLYATVAFENSYGYSENYYLYKSAQAGLGATTVEVS